MMKRQIETQEPENQEHPESLRRKVIILFFSGLLLLAAAAVGIGQATRDWGSIQTGWINQFAGAVTTAAGVFLVTWSVHTQYTHGKGTPAPAVATRKLVTQGPYAYSRNPMTLGALVLYLGIGIWIASCVVLLLTLITISTLLTYIYFHETQELTARFGEEYIQYKERTPFFLPGFRRRDP